MTDCVAELRKLALHCQFGAYHTEALRIAWWLQSKTQQKHFLAEHGLTFHRALGIAQSMEVADRDMHKLKGGDMAQQGFHNSTHSSRHLETAVVPRSAIVVVVPHILY